MTTAADHRLLAAAIALSRLCAPSRTAFSVGALLALPDGERIAEGYSRDVDEHVHAEESLLRRIPPRDRRVPAATLYTSLEPCSVRKSGAESCAALIAGAGIRRLVFAMREPELFVEGHGADALRAAGVEVVELAELAGEVRDVNAHLFVAP